MTKLTSNSDLSNKQKQARKESDLSQQILREIFQCSDDFSTPQRKTITPEIAEKIFNAGPAVKEETTEKINEPF